MNEIEDVAPELLERVEKLFRSKYKADETIAKLLKTPLDYTNANDYAVKVGEILSEVYQEVFSVDVLPEGRMYWNIADRVVRPTLENNYNLVSKFSKEVQANLNQQAGIGIKPIDVKLNQDKIKGILERLAESENYDDIKWILEEPPITFTQSIVDDYIKANVEFHAKAGMKPKIVRALLGDKTCKWCISLAGSYDYPNVPEDVYKRHERCRCTVTYKPDLRSAQDVWSKKWR